MIVGGTRVRTAVAAAECCARLGSWRNVIKKFRKEVVARSRQTPGRKLMGATSCCESGCHIDGFVEEWGGGEEVHRLMKQWGDGWGSI